MTDQSASIHRAASSLNGQIDILKRASSNWQADRGHGGRKDSTEKQVGYINKELIGLRELGAKHSYQSPASSRWSANERVWKA